jgi:hypothetical protein
MKTILKDVLDRTLSTAWQAVAGSTTAAALLHHGDLRSILVTAGAAAVYTLGKVLSTYASKAQTAASEVLTHPAGKTEQEVLRTLGQRLKG